MSRRVGIFPGSFDPVHTGHIAFALQALKNSKLDVIYFMPERRPRHKAHVEHLAHRVAMLKQATKPHPQFKVLELVDINFTVERTLPKLKSLFKGADLVFLFGSDTVRNISEWSKAERIISESEIVVGLRSLDDKSEIRSITKKWRSKKKQVTLIDSYAPDISSGKIREALRRQRTVSGVLRSVERYSNRHWLYISLAIDKP